jgi:hypothetical protein
MKKKSASLVFLLSLLLVLSMSAICLAEPSGLVVVRATDGSLWKATCNGSTCSSFTSFPGNFNSQPTVYWDEDAALYVIWGRASDSSIWRATFTRLGVFNNDWAAVPGSTPSPIAGAGGGIMNNFSGTGQSYGSVNVGSSVTNIANRSTTVPVGGYLLCRASGGLELFRSTTSGIDYVRIYLATSSGGTATTWTGYQLPVGYPTGSSVVPYAFERWFPVSEGLNTIYVTSDHGGTATANVWNTMLSCQFYSYSY